METSRSYTPYSFTPGFRLKSLLAGVLTVFLSFGAYGVAVAQNAPRERILINENWYFQKGDPSEAGDQLSYAKFREWLLPSGNDFVKPEAAKQRPEGAVPGEGLSYAQPDFDASQWRKLNLPHDWGIEGPFDISLPGETGKLPWHGIAWYRKTIDLPATDAGRSIFLDVDGAMSYASVWCNGKFVGGRPYGYSSWRVDLTPYVKTGAANTLAIRLDNPENSSRWYPGGGIYRNVWLVKTSPVHVAQWGTFVTTPEVSAKKAKIDYAVTLDNKSTTERTVTVKTRISLLGKNGKPGADAIASFPSATIKIPAGKSEKVTATQSLIKPRLWDTENPNLYAAVTTIEENGKNVDRYVTPFGVRSIKFTADNGFLLNEKRVLIKGVCLHHDLGALGAAFNLRAAQRQLEIMKEMGVNSIRSSHNPPAPEVMDLCDRMGILVMNESYDAWKVAKKPFGYNVLFDDWAEIDLRTMIRRDRNHPSIIMWSVGNEIVEQTKPEGIEIAKQLTAIVHDEDITRPSTIGCNNTPAGLSGYQNAFDVFGYNYRSEAYPKFREANPSLPIIGSETSSAISSRGEYFFPFTNDKKKGKQDYQMSSYDLYAPEWGKIPDEDFKNQKRYPYSAGEWVWTGFDYLGEPTPYSDDSTNLLNFQNPEDRARAEKELAEMGKIKSPSRSSYFGIVDLAGLKKDRFYLYQSQWRSQLPMAHILPHWNWPDRVGEITPVHVYTSGDEAELFLNGTSLGRKKKGEFDVRLRWDEVKYTPGVLKVVAYKNGKKWATETVKTTGTAAKLVLSADRAEIKNDGLDLSYVTVTVADQEGLMVPRSKQKLKFTISGPGEIVATDNGDATDLSSFQSPERAAFNGKAIAIIRAKKGAEGTIKVQVLGEGLKTGTVQLQTN